MRKSYSELLKDPRWQRRRLEILNRSDFTCEACEADDRTLHVHHKLYRKGAMPWEYEDYELQALCENCHASDHEKRDRLNEAVALLDPAELDILLGFAEALACKSVYAPQLAVRNAEHAIGISACFWPNSEWSVFDLVNDRTPDGSMVDLAALWDLHRQRRQRMQDA